MEFNSKEYFNKFRSNLSKEKLGKNQNNTIPIIYIYVRSNNTIYKSCDFTYYRLFSFDLTIVLLIVCLKYFLMNPKYNNLTIYNYLNSITGSKVICGFIHMFYPSVALLGIFQY